MVAGLLWIFAILVILCLMAWGLNKLATNESVKTFGYVILGILAIVVITVMAVRMLGFLGGVP